MYEITEPVFSFSTLMESCHFGRYEVPTISLRICVVVDYTIASTCSMLTMQDLYG